MPGRHGRNTLRSIGRITKQVIIYSGDKGQMLWRQEMGANQSNGPITYMLDGKQWILAGCGDSLYAFSLKE